MAKSETNSRSRIKASLTRLAIVYEDPLRMKIVTELYMREMSPTQFFAEFGGGSVSRVARHFERLVEYGWLRLERTETGGKRRGAVEHFYRATELVVFDQETWAELPLPLRAAFSWTTFEQLTERVEEALVAGTFNARADRHLTWTSVLLDELGWKGVLATVNALFETVLAEQNRSKSRVAEFGGEQALVTVALAAFESPQITRDDTRQIPAQSDTDEVDRGEVVEPKMFFPMQLAKVLTDPEALQILAQLNLREMSPKQFHDEFGGGTMSSVGRRFRKLARMGWLYMVREESGGKRRGATEHFYRAVGPAILNTGDWSKLPDELRDTLTWKTFEQLREKVREAIGAGTLDARADRHVSWSLLLLDQLGWERVTAALEDVFQTIFLEEQSAATRIKESSEEPIQMTISLAAFESPKDQAKAP